MSVPHPISDAALDADIAIVAKKGRGKSYTARGLVERLLAAGRQVVVLDPLSTWWGLKAAGTGAGAGPGFPVPVIGGPHGDVPLDPEHLSDQARALAAHLVATRGSAVIDLGDLRKGSLVRFAEVLLEELYRTNRSPLWLVLEEADVLAPQQPMPDTTRVLGEVDRIARRGRNFGFRLISITQRPAKLNKDVLTQLSTLVALGLTSPQDRKAVEDWVAGVLDKAKAAEFAGALAGLAVGEGYVWTPDRASLERVRFPRNRTLDTSATPQAGAPAPKVRAVAADVAGLREAMLISAPTKEAAKINTPPAEQPASAEEIAAAERRGYKRGVEDGIRTGWSNAHRQLGDALIACIEGFALAPAQAPLASMTLPALTAKSREKSSPRPGRQQKSSRPAQKADARPAAVENATATKLTSPQRELLRSIAWWHAMGHAAPTRTQVAAIAGWRPQGSNLRNRLSELSAAGLVAYPGQGVVALTDAGRAAAPEPDLGRTLIDSILGILTTPQATLFNELRAGSPRARPDLAAAIGWEPAGSNLRNRLSELSALELVDYPSRGVVALQPWVTA